MYEHALRYWAKGLAPVALVPSTKKPWHSYGKRRDNGTIDAKCLENWFKPRTVSLDEGGDFDVSTCWIGLLTGKASAWLELIDFDVPGKHGFAEGHKEAAPAWEPWCELVRAHCGDELLDKLIIVETRSGGRHVMYRCPAMEGFGSQKLARREASPEELAKSPNEKILGLIETRSDPGLVAVAPTPGYRMLQGSFDEIPEITAEERDYLIGCARHLDAMPAVEDAPARPPRPKREGEITPFDDYEERAEWEQILEPHGWRKVGRLYGRMQLWVRPGKDGRRGWSARTGVGTAGDRFVTWSDVTHFNQEKVYKKSAVYAILNHGGDYSAAAKALAKDGYGRKAPPVPPAPKKPDQPEFVEKETPDGPELTIEEDDDPDFDFNDYGNAQRLIYHHGEELRYCGDWGRWLVWDGARWAEDAPENPGSRALAHSVGCRMRERKRTRAWAKTTLNTGRLSNMLREAQAMAGISVRASELDTNEMLLCAKNGVIDLRTGKLLEHSKEHLITKSVSVPFDPDAKCPEFQRFLQLITRERKGLVDLLIRALGYTLTGSTIEQKFFLMYGERGRNGKTTLMELMQELMGDQLCFTIRKKLLTDSENDSAKFAKAQIEGKRMVYANETSKRARFDVEFIKEFIGGKWMEAERKGKDGYNFRVQAKFWYAVNALPGADFDPSFATRVVPIPFDQSFYPKDDKEYREGDLPPDKHLSAKLRSELPGILALLVRGCARWQEMGDLGNPEEVVALREQYEEQNDHVGAWLAENCKKDDGLKSSATILFSDYRQFCKDQGLRASGRMNEFSQRLGREPGVRHIKPQNRSVFVGIGLMRTTIGEGQQPLGGQHWTAD